MTILVVIAMEDFKNGEPVYNEEYGWGDVEEQLTENRYRVQFDNVSDWVNMTANELEPDYSQRMLNEFDDVSAAEATDVTNTEFDLPGGDAGTQKILVKFESKVKACQYFNKYINSVKHDVFWKPDGRFEDGKHDREIVVFPLGKRNA